MIDGIIIELLEFDSKLWENNPKLDFVVLTNLSSKEEIGSRRASYKGLDFVIEPRGKVKIKGSIHKYFNDGLHNANRFTFENFLEAVSQLSEFGVIPEKAVLRGFEIGLNIDLTSCKIPSKTFLDSILYCRGVRRSDMDINGESGYGYKFKTTNTKYKFYDKSAQSQIYDVELLRIETKFTRMRAVESLKIRTLKDLMNRDKLISLISSKYLKFIDETIFFEWDQIKTTRKIEASYKSKFKDLRNPDWWIKGIKSRVERQRNKEKLERLIDKHAKRDIKKILKDLILSEIEEFSRSKKCYEYTEFEELQKWQKSNSNADKSVTNTPRIVRCGLTDRREVKKEKRYCLTCGKEITHQRKGSKYCSDNRKCRDKAYNALKSENKKAVQLKQEKEILHLIHGIGSDLNLIRTTNPNTKRIKGKPKRRTSIIVTVNGKERYFHGTDARFFLREFEKKIEQREIIPKNKLKRA
ncbi:hypothetical protein [Marinifilum fragile]|uniref:hypothetical protein n=1 Tax=Marinifilum fragile TaxID=570161 RepID=UPI002AA8CE61|nr:hypothetical protein [Marinifilum fragile]